MRTCRWCGEEVDRAGEGWLDTFAAYCCDPPVYDEDGNARLHSPEQELQARGPQMGERPVNMLISSLDELRAWIDQAPQRHAKTGDHACSCGWRGDMCQRSDGTYRPYDPSYTNYTAWEAHDEVVHISDLGDVLPSDTSSADTGPQSWRECCEWLYDTMDSLHNALDNARDAESP